MGARVRSFPPLARDDARVLILGSMPGEESLRQQQYYAYPHNQFWPFMGALFGAGRELAYDERIERLLARGIAVWDVLKTCVRNGSLDSSIVADTERPNDFRRFFEAHPDVEAVFFNGSRAESAFARHVLPRLGALASRLWFTRLPSTSPAHAGLPRAAKLAAWRTIENHL